MLLLYYTKYSVLSARFQVVFLLYYHQYALRFCIFSHCSDVGGIAATGA